MIQSMNHLRSQVRAADVSLLLHIIVSFQQTSDLQFPLSGLHIKSSSTLLNEILCKSSLTSAAGSISFVFLVSILLVLIVSHLNAALINTPELTTTRWNVKQLDSALPLSSAERLTVIWFIVLISQPEASPSPSSSSSSPPSGGCSSSSEEP